MALKDLIEDKTKFIRLDANTPHKVGKYGSPQSFDVNGYTVTGKGGHINPHHGGTQSGGLPKHPAAHTSKMETTFGKIGVVRTIHQINKLKTEG